MNSERILIITGTKMQKVSYIKNETERYRRVILMLAGMLLVGACGDLKPGYETPTINVSYFRQLPGQGITPRFRIGLHIINPNDFDLDIRGISYTVSLQGQRILIGVAGDVPGIPAYGEGDIDLQASTDVISSIRLITDLMRQRRDTFNYQLEAKLDIKGFARKVHVVREGKFSFRDER